MLLLHHGMMVATIFSAVFYKRMVPWPCALSSAFAAAKVSPVRAIVVVVTRGVHHVSKVTITRIVVVVSS